MIIVATVSAIYGLGDPVSVPRADGHAAQGQRRRRATRSCARSCGIQYSRNDVAFERGTFRVRGDTVEIFPAYEEQAVRVELWGDEIERISKINPLTGETIADARARGDLPGEALRHRRARRSSARCR